MSNNSPWIYQLKDIQSKRKVTPLSETKFVDIAVIGGGIAGTTTAYYALKETPFNVAIFEAQRVAGGATGYNAGHVLSQFERPFASLVEEYGLKLAGHAQKKVDSAWILLEKILNEAHLRVPFFQVTGYTGLSTVNQLLLQLNENFYKAAAGLRPDTIFVASEIDAINEIPKRFYDFYTLIAQKDILTLLETDDTNYIAAVASRKGCLNSALFTEELAVHLLKAYADRFDLHEETPVHTIRLKKGFAILESDKFTFQAKKVVLCTNGFSNINIINEAGREINSTFHQMVKGTVGYMAGYLEDMDTPPVVLRYYRSTDTPSENPHDDEPYVYLTRRPFLYDADKSYNLVAIGGPERQLHNKDVYNPAEPYPTDSKKQLDDFFFNQYKGQVSSYKPMTFYWHGLMAYTPNGIRCIGTDPHNKSLMYNLGCNGIGILSSIYGAKRISQLLQAKYLSKSIFDVDQYYNQ